MGNIEKGNEYRQFVLDISKRVRSGQLAALRLVNFEQILMYWDLGGIIVEKQKQNSWGKSIVEQLAKDLQKDFVGMQGLSATNLWRMRAFYLAYSIDTILPPAVGELEHERQRSMPQILTEIGWSHNCVIIEKCKSVDERAFYIYQTKKFGWTKNVLIHQIENQTFQKTIINQQNFKQTLSEDIQNQAILAIKDEYTFDFLELGNEHSEY